MDSKKQNKKKKPSLLNLNCICKKKKNIYIDYIKRKHPTEFFMKIFLDIEERFQ